MRKTSDLIDKLHQQCRVVDDTMSRTIEDQILIENSKLEKLEKSEEQWLSQAWNNLFKVEQLQPHLQTLLTAANKKIELFGPDLIHLQGKTTEEKMTELSSLTTLTINIQNSLCHWEKFHHHLSFSAEAIV